MLCITKTILEKYEGEESCVHIPEGVTTIGAHAFEESKTLKEVYLPDSVTQIDDYAFFECQSLTDQCVVVLRF